jgi:RNA polymerase subunit RPABC4/transcription elongation factor Spt4
MRDIQCGRCNEINTGDSKFCGECGNQLIYSCTLSSGVQCRCGFINAQGQKFCSECGNSLAM